MLQHVFKSIPIPVWVIRCFLACILITLAIRPSSASAASGLPNSSEFGYGARLDPWGQYVQLATNTVAAIGLDWMSIDLDWALIWPDSASLPDLAALDQAISRAGQNHINVLISITHPPLWALTPAGPDPDKTSGLVSQLVRRYPGVLLAIELFPAANTTLGWGAPPDPIAYTRLLAVCQTAIQTASSPVILVGAGLIPLPSDHPLSDMDDLKYLGALYQAGAANFMPVIGLRMNEIIGDPMSVPSESEPRFLRHYEDVRKVMLDYGQQNSIIWITGFSWPASMVQPVDQITWLEQAYRLMKSQLYIGVAFFDRINLPKESLAPLTGSPDIARHTLIQTNTTLLSVAPAFGQIITMNRTGQVVVQQVYLAKKIANHDFKSTLKRYSP